jgi:ribonuclease HI
MIIYTDGSYSPARDQGGLAFVVTKDDKEVHRFSKAYKHVTNNKMELAAVILALAYIKTPIDSLTIKTDSMYVIGCATKGWKRKKNQKLWEQFDKVFDKAQALVKSNIEFAWVEGHSDNSFNNLCDSLAVSASKEYID